MAPITFNSSDYKNSFISIFEGMVDIQNFEHQLFLKWA